MDPASSVSRERPTGRPLLWLEILGLALGSITYAIDPLSFIEPRLAVGGVLWIASAAVIVRILSPLAARPRLSGNLEIAAMVVYATLMTASTGATSSPFITLYALPVIGAALSWKRWQVLVLALAVTGLAIVQSGFLDSMNDMYLVTTIAVLINVLAPAVAAALILAGFRDRLGSARQQVTELAARDALTGLLNLQSFESALATRHHEAERTGHSYSVAVVDIDNVRTINETLGHDAGSQMIAAVAKAITRSIRAGDLAARMGGDVFVVLLADADQSTATTIAQRIRNNVYSGTLLVESRLVRATVSIGVASFPRDGDAARQLMILADQRKEQDKSLRRPPAR